MRGSLLPGICRALAANLNHGLSDVALFEVGRAFWEGRREGLAEGSLPDGTDLDLPPLPAEPLLLGMAVHCGGDAQSAAVELRHVQSVMAGVVAELAGAGVTTAAAEVAGIRPGRCGRMRIGGGVTAADVGVFGELTPDRVAALELRGRVIVAELRLDVIAPVMGRVARYNSPPRFPSIVQDLAVVVAVDAQAGPALAEIRAAGTPLLEAVELYDEYRDERLGADRKGWTFRLTYRAADRTLRGDEAGAAQRAVATALVDRCGATIRE